MHRQRLNHKERRGIILLVVLSSLTFFSLLVAAYLVFSNQSRQSAFVLSARNTRTPDINGLLNESLMTLIRGTNDVNNPFFGMSLLDDYYGRDGIDMSVHRVTSFQAGPLYLGRGIVRFPVVDDTGARPLVFDSDDLFTGRLITFTEGPLENKTYRVIRSLTSPRPTTAAPPLPAVPTHDDLFIELGPDIIGDPTTAPTAQRIRSLFYDDPTNLNLPNNAFRFHLNGVPMNAAGVGFDGANINATVTTIGSRQPEPGNTATQVGFPDLPVALQPNHIRLAGGTNVDKSVLLGTAGSDFDEGYDAPDYFNWFLSHRHSDGTVIPSFHRPSVINYILNEVDWSGTPPGDDYRDLIVSIARGTMRPIPIAEDMLRPNSNAINPRFTGGSSEYALRSALAMRLSSGNPATAATSYLDQLAKALIEGPWDVDNDSDGIRDSVWVDLGLPLFTSREGKLLRPLVAPMIEDLSGRLNVNAIGSLQLDPDVAGSIDNAQAYWADAYETFGNPANQRNVFRGIGYGPADIMFPASYSYTSTASTPGVISNAGILSDISDLLNDRYRFGSQAMPTAPEPALPGRDDADSIDVLRTGLSANRTCLRQRLRHVE